MESAAGQVSPTGESVAELLARIGRQAALIGEYRDREVAQDAVIEALQERVVAQDAKIEALDLLVADLIANPMAALPAAPLHLPLRALRRPARSCAAAPGAGPPASPARPKTAAWRSSENPGPMMRLLCPAFQSSPPWLMYYGEGTGCRVSACFGFCRKLNGFRSIYDPSTLERLCT